MSTDLSSAPKVLLCGEKIAKIRLNTPVFGRVVYEMFTNELSQLWIYWTAVHENVELGRDMLTCDIL